MQRFSDPLPPLWRGGQTTPQRLCSVCSPSGRSANRGRCGMRYQIGPIASFQNWLFKTPGPRAYRQACRAARHSCRTPCCSHGDQHCVPSSPDLCRAKTCKVRYAAPRCRPSLQSGIGRFYHNAGTCISTTEACSRIGGDGLSLQLGHGGRLFPIAHSCSTWGGRGSPGTSESAMTADKPTANQGDTGHHWAWPFCGPHAIWSQCGKTQLCSPHPCSPRVVTQLLLLCLCWILFLPIMAQTVAEVSMKLQKPNDDNIPDTLLPSEVHGMCSCFLSWR